MTARSTALEEAPALPPVIARQLDLPRAVYRLQSGPYAGRRLHFIDRPGSDPAARPVVLLHGNPTWSFLWRKVIAALPEHRCLAPDLLGLGFSDRLPRMADHTVSGHAEAIAEWLRALDVQGAVLVAQDWGGPIGVCAGAREGQRIAGVVLANTSVLVPEKPRGTAFHRFARRPVLSDLAFRVLGVPQTILHRVQGDPASIRGDVAAAYRWPLRRWRERIAPLALARLVPDRPDHPSVPELRRGEAWIRSFQGPIELVWGLRDPVLGRALKRHQEAFPNAAVTPTEAGHFLQEEVPEELAAAVRRVAA